MESPKATTNKPDNPKFSPLLLSKPIGSNTLPHTPTNSFNLRSHHNLLTPPPMAPPPPQPPPPPPLKKHHITLFILILSTIYLLSHYSLSPPLTTSTTTHIHPTNFTFTIKILTYNRLTSLTRLLTSLSSAHYSPLDHPINLHIYIDHFPNSTDVGPNLDSSRKILEFIDGFDWVYGPKVVHYRTVNVGLQAQWLEAWWPVHDHDFVLVLEDDLEVSPHYYKFLKKLIMEFYYNPINFSPYIFGATLQRPRFVPGKHGNKMNLDNGTGLFLYPLVGTWGQLLFPRPWKEFRLWYDDHKARGIKPFLDGMVTNGWYKKMGERIWTPWFIKFIHSRGYFNIYTNFPHERALSVSHRDAGVNYGRTAGPDSALIEKNSHDVDRLIMQPLRNMQWYDFCFRKVLPGRVAKKLDDVDPIIRTMEQQKPIFLVSLLQTSEEVVRNLICHFERLDIRNYIFIVPDSKSDLLLNFARRGHPVVDTEDVFGSIMKKKHQSAELIKDIVIKTHLIKKSLDAGFNSWVISGNMLPLINDLPLDSTTSSDDFYVGKSSRYVVARSSSSSRRIWGESFVRKLVHNTESLVGLGGGDFIDAVEKFSEKQGLRLKNVDEAGSSLKLETVDVNQSVSKDTKTISWSSATGVDSVRRHLERLNMWIIDDDSSCKAVICHQS